MKLVDLTTAQALQELGYDGECNRWYNRDRKLKPTHLVDDDIPAPRLDDSAYWIRDKFHLFIEIRISLDNSYCWGICDIAHPTNDIASEQFDLEYNTYDEALEAAVAKAIEIIKTRSDERR